MTTHREHPLTSWAHAVRIASLLLRFSLLAMMLAACSGVDAPSLTTHNPGSTPSAMAMPTSATPAPESTPSPKPTTPPYQGGTTVVILHTNDVFGQMDPCG